MIVPAANVALARTLCATLAGDAGQNMFMTGLSPTGAEPATHWISTGMIGADFAALMPLTVFVEGEPETTPGQPDTIVALATEAGMSVTLAEIEALLAACDVTLMEPLARMGELGLQLVQEPL